MGKLVESREHKGRLRTWVGSHLGSDRAQKERRVRVNRQVIGWQRGDLIGGKKQGKRGEL